MTKGSRVERKGGKSKERIAETAQASGVCCTNRWTGLQEQIVRSPLQARRRGRGGGGLGVGCDECRGREGDTMQWTIRG